MIIGEYPCCDGPFYMATPDRTPAYTPDVCPHCGAKVWHVASRVIPISYTEKDFLERYDVDLENHIVTPKPGFNAPELTKVSKP